MKKKKIHLAYRVRFQPPKWFSQKAWDLTFNALTSGWQMNLATFNVIPEDSLVFEYAQVGNLAGLRKLFADGLASPLDYNPNGWTILDVSAPSGDNTKPILIEGVRMRVYTDRFILSTNS